MTNYKNAYNKEHYDRINLMVPAGEKERIQKFASSQNMSANEYIWSAIQKEMHALDILQTTNITNRRYVGSKQSLIPFIRSAVKNISFHSFADLFSGTGVVADTFNDKKRIITNDIF